MNDRQKDFKLIFLLKEPDAYVFTSEANHFKKLGWIILTKDVNRVVRVISKQLPDRLNITSHSF